MVVNLMRYDGGMSRIKIVVSPGTRFGLLTVVCATHLPCKTRPTERVRVFKCLCDCGNEVFVLPGQLGKSYNSCGCMKWQNRSSIPGMEHRASIKAGNPESSRRGSLWRRFRLTLEDYEAMLVEQGGVCKMCGGTDPGKYAFSVDHDHSCCPGRNTCGKCIRGLLCASCNVFLGRLDLRGSMAFAYLMEYEYREGKVMQP